MSRSKIISVIDVGSTKITTIIAQHFLEENQINVIGVSTSEANKIKRGEVKDIVEATESITKSVEGAERMAGYSINSAIVSITAPHISSLNSEGVVAVSNPNGEIVEDDVSRVIEAARAISLPSNLEIIHVIPREFKVDGQEGILDPVGMTGVRLEVESHIVIASMPAIKNLSRCINEIGINIDSLVYSGFAAAESVLTETEKELGVILIDIGGTVTSITIYTESYPCFVKIIPVGAKNVTNDLAIGLRLSLENADKLKLYLSSQKAKDEQKNDNDDDNINLKRASIYSEEKTKISRIATVDGIIKPRLDEIFNLIKQEVKDSGLGGATPAGVVLTGGGAEVIGVKQACQRVLGLPVRVGQSKEINGLVDEIMTPAYASSLGLIEYAVKSNHESSDQSMFSGIGSKMRGIKVGGLFQKLIKTVKPLLP
jgi:cell division protein FtsA